MDSNTTRVDPRQSASTEEIVAGLNDLLQLDHDAIGSYEIAMERLEDRDHASQIAGFRLDHERHVRDLNELIRSLGGTPRNEPHATGPLKQALQGLGGVAGDKGLLMAFRTNELQVRTKYDGYASKAVMWPAEVKRVIDANALDEERHYRWVADVMKSMGLGDGEGPETHAANLARENVGGRAAGVADKVTDAASSAASTVSDAASSAASAVSGAASSAASTAGDVASTVRERASDLASTARERVTAGVEAVQNRVSGMMGGSESGTTGELAPGTVERVRFSAGDTARDVRGDFEDRVREKPLQTLVLAGIAGFVIGRLLR